ncbi:MAG: sensor histidine kinase [Ruminococcus sp.]|nr:sensor histidine kinase [Ruminococcus sp.]
MRKITDKLLLLVCCLFVSVSICSGAQTVVFLLLTVSLSAVCQLAGNGRVSLASELVFLAISLFYPGMLCYAPVILYDIMCDKRAYFLPVIAVELIYTATTDAGIPTVLMIAVLCTMSFVQMTRTAEITSLEEKYKISRDSFAEQNNSLSEKNRHLREKQDNDIRVATLKERNRIAREIHDNVGHLLSRSILQVGALCITEQDTLRKESLESLNETLNSAMTTVRQSVHNLHDDSIDLKNAVSEAIRPLEGEDVEIMYEYGMSNEVPNNVKFSFISIVKECVSNVVKHSNADKVSVILREHPGFYQLMFEDNGDCSDIHKGNGIGLDNMKSRVDDLGGFFSVSYDEKGFRIFITIKKQSE